MYIKPSILRGFVLFVISCASTQTVIATEHYAVADLGTLDGTRSKAYGLNDLGQVVGESDTPSGDRHAFLWLPEPAYSLPAGMHDLGTLGGSESAAFGISNLGHVVGRADTATPGVYHAFLWDPQNGMQDLGTLGGQLSEAHAVNDLGDVVGRAQNADGVFRAFYRWSEGLMEWFPLILPGDQESAGFAIGYANLHMAGASYSTINHAFAFGGEAGLYVLEDFGFGSTAFGLDDLRRVGSVTMESSADHAALWETLAVTDLGTLGGTNSRAYAINDFDQIVGESDTTTGMNHAFLREGGAMTDLNDLLPANTGWQLNEARDINENGVIVGTGTIKGQTHAFLLWATSTVVGQSVNIDYGDGAGTPPNDYAAAGSPGVWNALSGAVDTPEALVGLDGSPIAATVTLVSGASGAPSLFDHPGTAGNEERLLDDHSSGGTDVGGSIFFAGLENGSYEVIVYAWTPSDPDVFTSVLEDCQNIISLLIGGAWPGQLVDGITQARFTKTVVDGTIQICTAGGSTWEGAINGVQLVALNCNDGSGGACTLPPDRGPCDGLCERFFYNTCTQQCEPFIYGCCLGNANNFETVEACNAACPYGVGIPAVSEWGLAIMTLIVLASGSAVLVRRRTTPM